MTSLFRSLSNFRLITRYTISKHFSTTSRNFNEKAMDDGPVKFSKSPASTYKAKTSRTGETEPRLWYEPYVLYGSLAVFMIYFCILREENDIDQELNTSLYRRIQGLEELQLKQSLKYNLDHGLDTKDIITRLKEIEDESKHLKHESE